MQTTTVVQQNPARLYDTGFALILSVCLAIFAGIHGGHRFYTGEIGLGIAQCITCGGCWVWSIIEWINIEVIVEKANRKAGWTGQVTTTTVQPGYYQQPTVYTTQPQYGQPVVVQYQQPMQYQQQPVQYQQQATMQQGYAPGQVQYVPAQYGSPTPAPSSVQH